MADRDHFKLLQKNPASWNDWRRREPSVRPDLSKAELCRALLGWSFLMQGESLLDVMRRPAHRLKVDLSGANLSEANLSKAELHSANLREADLRKVNLSNANLREADLYKADLRGANLDKADLREANLHAANLSGQNLSRAAFGGANLSEAKLHGADLRGTNLSGADLRKADLRETDLGEANLSGADLGGADLREADLSKVDFYGADLRGINLSGQNFRERDFSGRDLSGAKLSDVDFSEANLQRANLIDVRLDSGNLTGAKLWGSLRDGWSIKDVVCKRAFWDRGGEKPTEYEEGEFERIFAEKPHIVVPYPGGMTAVDLLALPLVVERLQAEHPGSALQIRSVQNDAGGASVTITVEDIAGRGPEAFGLELVRIQTKLECVVEERDRLQQRLDSIVSEGISKIAEILALPRQEIHVHRLNGLATIEGPDMNRDTYNIPGQAGAVGPGAHAHDNTFQQVQGVVDLPKLAEELGRLRTAMKSKAIGARAEDKAIGAVADAEEAAAKGDRSGVLQHLKSAGEWTLSIAKDIGVPVAIEVLKQAM